MFIHLCKRSLYLLKFSSWGVYYTPRNKLQAGTVSATHLKPLHGISWNLVGSEHKGIPVNVHICRKLWFHYFYYFYLFYLFRRQIWKLRHSFAWFLFWSREWGQTLDHAFFDYLLLNHLSTPSKLWENLSERFIKVKRGNCTKIKGTQWIDLMISCFEIITIYKQK